jgi:prepilin-type N-terminal cleavage/methylation domain-containing protein
VRPRCAERAGQHGFTLVELLVAATVFTVVAGAVINAIIASTALNRTNRESVLAMEAASSIVETLKAAQLDEVFARFDASAGNDPVAGVSPGAAFEVAGLEPQSADADGFVGGISFPGDGATLREDAVDADLGMPRDLDGDGAIDALDHSGDYRLLPVRVTVRWTGKTGARSLELVTVLGDL